MIERLLRVEPRLLAALFATLVAGVCALGWQFVLRKPVAEYRELRASRAALEQSLASARGGAASQPVQDEAQALERRLAAAVVTGAADAATLDLIRRLDALSARHNVRLVAVRPGTPRADGAFSTLPFDVEALGGYANLHRWLRDAEAELAPFYLVEFAIRPSSGSGQLALAVKLGGLAPREAAQA